VKSRGEIPFLSGARKQHDRMASEGQVSSDYDPDYILNCFWIGTQSEDTSEKTSLFSE
jgi:hypothetical protein